MTLEILTSDTLAPMRHGFFTRKGGVSSGVFEGLNCGLGSSDQSEAVLQPEESGQGHPGGVRGFGATGGVAEARKRV